MSVFIIILNIVAILTGSFCLRKGGPVILYLVLFIISIAFINENVIVEHSNAWWHVKRNVFYNIYSLLEIAGWFLIYRFIFSPRSRVFIYFLGIVTVICTAIEFIANRSISQFHTFSYAMFAFFSILLALLYTLKVTSREYHRLTLDPAFCICGAAICFHSIFLLNLLTVMDVSYWSDPEAAKIFDYLQSGATTIYFLLICIAFILFYCRSPKQARQDLY